MQKKLIKLAIVTTFIIPQMRAWAGPDVDQIVQPTAAISRRIEVSKHQYNSTESFLDFMDDKLLNLAYLNAQKLRLKTVGDQNLEAFLEASPMLQKIAVSLRKQFAVDLQTANTGNLLQDYLVTKESNPRLFHQLMRVMRAQGFSREQMKNAKFFRKMADVNAYAYTASVDGVGFVLQSGLDDIANPTELRGVMGHELGHIRSGHVFMGVLDSVLQVQVVKQLIGLNEGSVTSADMRAWEHMRDAMSEKTIDSIEEKYGVSARSAHDAFSKMMKRADEVIAKSFSGDQRTLFLQQYLELKIDTLKDMEMNTAHIQLLIELQEKLRPNQVMKANMEQVAALFDQVVGAADSRNMESSADAFGDIVVRPSRAARMDTKFAGAELPTRMSPEQIQHLIQQIRHQVNLTRKMNTRAEYNNFVGNLRASDHPFSNLRVLKQAAFDQHIDRIALANPFLRHIVLRDAVVNEIDQRAARIVQLNAAIQSGRLSAKVMKKAEALLKKTSSEIANLELRLPQIELQISNLMIDPRFIEGNPRVLNLLDFRLAELQISQVELSGVEQALKGPLAANIPEEKKQAVLENVRGYVDSKRQDPLLQKAISALEAEIEALKQKTTEGRAKALALRESILERVKAAIEPTTSSIENSIAVRAEIGKTTKSVDRISLLKPTSGPKNSNTEWDASAPAFKDEVKPRVMSCKDLFK